MRFSIPVRVYYEDTDAGGVVYYANYLKYFERGRTEALREMGFNQDELIRRQDTIFAVRSMEINYLKPARFNDALTVLTAVAESKKAAVVFEQSVLRDGEPRPLAAAAARIACLAASTLKPKAMPPALAQAIAETIQQRR